MENQIMDKLIEENILKIETYVVWKNKRFALKDFIKETLKELEDYKSRINKAIHLIEHNDIYDYSVFEEDLLKILNGE